MREDLKFQRCLETVKIQPRKGSLEALLYAIRPLIPADHLFHGEAFSKMENGSKYVIPVVKQVMWQGIVLIL